MVALSCQLRIFYDNVHCFEFNYRLEFKYLVYGDSAFHDHWLY